MGAGEGDGMVDESGKSGGEVVRRDMGSREVVIWVVCSRVGYLWWCVEWWACCRVGYLWWAGWRR